ncbi:MAG TPA: cation:proton antiporter [Jatrophihabitans sp.]|nr:cation:proton antiporter [Jatrophihabitans sp.]
MGHLSLSTSLAVHLWVEIAALYVVARVLGLAARRFGQPEVVGSLLAGVLLGPSVLGAIWPSAGQFMIPAGEGAHLLGAIAGFSLLIVLLVLGAETDLPLLRQLGRPAAFVSASSIVVPLAIGSVVVYAFADELIPGDNTIASAVLLGGALAVSSLPVIARLVSELGVGRRNFGQVAFATATANDLYGFLLLIVVSVAVNGSLVTGVIVPIGGLLVLLALFAVFGQRTVDRLLRAARKGGPNPAGALSVAVGVGFAAAAVLQSVEVEAALGAFFAGIALGRSRFQHSESMRQLEVMSGAVFAPLYFATAGLQVDLGSLDSAGAIVALVVVFVVAIAAKAAGAALGARFARMERKESVALAVLLNGRGAMQVIIGTAGLRLGLLSETSYTVLLVVSIVSSSLVAPFLRRLVGSWPGSETEQQRLAHEHRLRTNAFVRAQRLLVPLLDGSSPLDAIRLLDRAWPAEAELTTISTPSSPAAALPCAQATSRRLRQLSVDTDDLTAATLTEAKLGYGVIAVGLPENDPAHGGRRWLPDELLNSTPLPTVLVRRGRGFGQAVGAPLRVAVAVNGTVASQSAEELAHGLADHLDADLLVVHVTPSDVTPADEPTAQPNRAAARPLPALQPRAQAVLVAAEERASNAGIASQLTDVAAARPLDGLADMVDRERVDVLVLGTRLRRVADQPFLGHTAEGVLDAVDGPDLVIVALPDASPPEATNEPYVDRRQS